MHKLWLSLSVFVALCVSFEANAAVDPGGRILIRRLESRVEALEKRAMELELDSYPKPNERRRIEEELTGVEKTIEALNLEIKDLKTEMSRMSNTWEYQQKKIIFEKRIVEITRLVERQNFLSERLKRLIRYESN